MESKIIILTIIYYISLISSSISIFVKEVKYPEFSSKNVNTDYCGYTFVPIISKMNFSKTCFLKIYHNFTIIDSIKRLKSESVKPRIFNGEIVNPSEAPWAVSIKIMYNELHSRKIPYGGLFKRVIYIPVEVTISVCSGSLITFEWVITAEHCLPTNSSHWIKVSAGLTPGNAWEGRQHRFARKDNFFRLNDVDLALVKLPEPFTKVDHDGQFFINTICLPQKTEFSNEEEEIAVMYGLGGTANQTGSSTDLVKGTFRIQPYIICQNINDIFTNINVQWNKTLCSNTTMTGVTKTCTGDSGSGLVQYTNKYKTRAVLFGVHRGGIRSLGANITCSDQNLYSYLAAVSVHIDWILDIIRNN